MEYRVQQLSHTLLRDELPFLHDKEAGWPIPDFDLPTTDGGRARKRDFQDACPLLVTFACLTSPATASAAPVLRRLHRDYGERIAFLTVYVRESHPGEKIPQPSTMERKLRHAAAYSHRDAIPWLVAVDDLEGSFHRAMGGGSGTAFLVDARGLVAFHTLWANDERPLRRAMAALARGASSVPARAPHQRPVLPWLRSLVHLDDVVRAAGGDAVRDLRRQTPALYAACELAWIWRALTPLGRVALAGAGALSAAGLLATLRLARHRH